MVVWLGALVLIWTTASDARQRLRMESGPIPGFFVSATQKAADRRGRRVQSAASLSTWRSLPLPDFSAQMERDLGGCWRSRGWSCGGLVISFFKEIGWTGFATHVLKKRHGLLATGLIEGPPWGVMYGPFYAETAGGLSRRC
jgi:hypothetical protein